MKRHLDPGTVVLVSGGPGDPDLITVAGHRAVQEADVIQFDHLAPDLRDQAQEDAELIEVGKLPRGPATPQERINELLIEHAKAGRRVVRLKGGDAFVFGRGGEEWLACAEAGVPVRVVPGVTSATAVPAIAGIPVTHRTLSQGFTVVSGHVPPGDPRSEVDWAALAVSGATLVILMGVANLAAITSALVAAGCDQETPAAVVSAAFSHRQAVLRGTVSDIASAAAASGVRPPAITVIGAVAGLDLTGRDDA